MFRASQRVLIALGTATALLAVAACNGGPDSDAQPPAPPAPITDETTVPGPALQQPPPDSIPERAATIRDTLMLEGMPEVTTSTLVRVPRGDDALFSTYVPEGLRVEHVDRNGGAGLRIAAAFAGAAEPQAYMHVHLHPDGTSLEQARDAAGQFLRMLAPSDDPVDVTRQQRAWREVESPGWALQAHAFEYDGDSGTRYTGRIIVARHGSRFFHVITHYPPEYGDGLGPRFDRILEHWRWEDTGLTLRG